MDTSCCSKLLVVFFFVNDHNDGRLLLLILQLNGKQVNVRDEMLKPVTRGTACNQED